MLSPRLVILASGLPVPRASMALIARARRPRGALIAQAPTYSYVPTPNLHLSLSPGRRTGCLVATLDATGWKFANGVIPAYPLCSAKQRGKLKGNILCLSSRTKVIDHKSSAAAFPSVDGQKLRVVRPLRAAHGCPDGDVGSSRKTEPPPLEGSPSFVADSAPLPSVGLSAMNHQRSVFAEVPGGLI